MMATTHALAGVLVGAVTLLYAPELTPVAVAAGFAGGVFPDLDLYAGHRKTLHFPVYFAVLAVPTGLLAVLAPSAVTVTAGAFLVAAALHSVMDAFGGGLELKPWEGTSERAVYDHFRGVWVTPRRWVRYDGAPEDLLLATALATPSVTLFHGWVQTAVLGVLAVSAVNALLRKPMVRVAEWLVGYVPDHFVGHVPDRFVADIVESSAGTETAD